MIKLKPGRVGIRPLQVGSLGTLSGFFLGLKMDTKMCTTCGIEKPVSEFHKHKRHKDGLRSECKACKKIQARDYRVANREKEIARRRKHRVEHREETTAYNREYRRTHKKEMAAYDGEYEKQHPERIKATSALNWAIRSGKIIRPDKCSNPLCSCECKPEGHHWDYEEVNWLDIIWTCRSCHLRIHATGQDKTNVINWNLITPLKEES